MFRVGLSQTLDLNASLNGGAADTGVTYEAAPGSAAVLTVNSSTGVVTPVAVGAGVVLVKENGVTIDEIFVEVLADAEMTARDEIEAGTKRVSVGAEVIGPNLIYNIDIANPLCYSGSGSNLTDLVGGVTASVVANGNNPVSPTYNSNEKSISLNVSGSTVVLVSGIDTYPLSSYTVEVWVKPEEQNAGVRNPLLYVDSRVGMITERGVGSASSRVLDIQVWGALGYGASQTEATPGVWTCYILTMSSNGAKFYRNGILEAQVNGNAMAGGAPGYPSVLFGNRDGSNQIDWNGIYKGEISILRFYNKALDLSEVQQKFNNVKSRFGL